MANYIKLEDVMHITIKWDGTKEDDRGLFFESGVKAALKSVANLQIYRDADIIASKVVNDR